MPHILEYPTAIKNALYKTSIAPIPPICEIKVESKTVTNGVPSTGYSQFTMFITDRLPHAPGLKIGRSAPYLPAQGTDSLIQASEVQIEVLNPEGYFAATQSGAILSPIMIEQGKVWIRANITEAAQTLDMFGGRIMGRPTEKFGRTSFQARSTMYETLNDVIYDVEGTGQRTYMEKGELRTETATITGTNGSFELFAGITYFDPEGIPREWVDNTQAADGAALSEIVPIVGAKCGKYEIEFINDTSFTLTYPDGTALSGNTGENYNSTYIFIGSSSWHGTGKAGQKITFQIAWTACGNPVTMAMYHIKKGLRLTSTGFVGGFVNWAAFEALEKRFDDYPVWVTITNTSNEVFENRVGSMPINRIRAAQQCLDHVWCRIYDDENGNISVRSPYIYEEPVYDIGDQYAITNIELTGQKRINYIRLKYGSDGKSGNTAGEMIADLRTDPVDKINETTFTLPFFKLGISDNAVRAFRDLVIRRYLTRQFSASVSMTGNFSLTQLPGDRVRLVSTQNPVGIGYYEATDVTNNFNSGNIGIGKIEYAACQEPEGTQSLINSYQWGNPLF